MGRIMALAARHGLTCHIERLEEILLTHGVDVQ
jgi:hypothetical protein